MRHVLLPRMHFMYPVTWVERVGVDHFDVNDLHFHAWAITVNVLH